MALPKIYLILPLDKIPDKLNAIESGIQNIISNVYYQNYSFSSSKDGGAGNVSIVILFDTRVAIDFGGTGFALVFNPAYVSGASLTQLPVNLSYNWPLIGVLNKLNISNFSSSPTQYFSIITELLKLDPQELLQKSISTFITSSTPLTQFVNEVNSNTDYTITIPLQAPANTDPNPYYTLIQQLAQNNLSLLEVIFDNFINPPNTSASAAISNIETLVQSWISGFSVSTITDLLIPDVSFTIPNLTIALEFPRTVLVPIYPPTGNSTPGADMPTPAVSALSFDIGALTFNSTSGFGFDTSQNITLSPSRIANTPLTLSLTNIEIDISDSTNIPAATADNRPLDFKGVFIGSGTIGLPTEWTSSSTNTTQIVATNLLIGSEGGITGTIGLANAQQFLTFNFFNAVTVIIKAFSLTFEKDQITGCNITGSFTSSVLQNPINIKVTISDAGYRIDLDMSTYPGQTAVTLVNNSDVKISVKGFTFGKMGDVWEFGIKGEIDVLTTIPGISDIIPKKFIINNFDFKTDGTILFDIEADWANGTTIKGNNSTGLTLHIPVNANLGGIFQLQAIDVLGNVTSSPTAFDIGFALRGATLNLGGVVIGTVDDLGLEAVVTHDETGNVSPFNIGMKVIGPKGLGISVNLGSAVTGGGYLFLDPNAGMYAGAIELSVVNAVHITAIGILNTKLPDGSPTFSLLAVICVEFMPGVQIGFGFTLNGVGGLVGIKRAMNIDRLRTGVKDGTLDKILFPHDIIKNINNIITDYQQVFPVDPSEYCFGALGYIAWGSPALVSIKFGLIIAVPQFEIAVIGVVSVMLPTKDQPLIQLNVAFLAALDLPNKLFSFDASIFNSKILVFTLAGDVAVRVAWGDHKEFIFSMGGFNPGYKPDASLKLPKMQRISISLLSGNPNFSISTYMAVTSNTFQFGADASLNFHVWKVALVGDLGFDVLFQFSPFYFSARVYLNIALRWGNTDLFAIGLDFTLSGPTPWNATGKAKFAIIGISISAHFDVTWGDRQNTALPDVQVLPLVQQAFALIDNWQALNSEGADQGISVRSLPANVAGAVVLHPNGTLVISQKIVPLGFTISKFGNQNPADFTNFTTQVSYNGTPMATTPQLENFAPAQFSSLQDNDKLASPSFVEMQGGVVVTNGTSFNTPDLAGKYQYIRKTVQYIQTIIDYPPPVHNVPQPAVLTQTTEHTPAYLFHPLVKGGAIKNCEASKQNKIKMQSVHGVGYTSESYAVVDTTSFTVYQGNNSYIKATEAEAYNSYNSLIAQNPALARVLQVVPSYSLS